MSSLRDLQRSLAYSAEQVRSRDKRIVELEQELQDRDIAIRTLEVEIDKFKQIIEPVTKQSLVNLSIQSLVVDDKKGIKPLPGRDGNSYSSSESDSNIISSSSTQFHDTPSLDTNTLFPKTKRIAISAEPLSDDNGIENAVVEKFPKGLE